MISFRVCDVFDGLATLEDGSVDLVVTSPPFLALRSYLPADHPDKGKEIGSEKTPAEFLDTLLRVSAELRRVLAPHGSIAVELGDTYAGSGDAGGDYGLEGWRAGQPGAAGSMKHERKHKVDGWGPFRDEWDGKKQGGGVGWPLAKSRTLIPELYRIALAYGFNPLTGVESPAGQWRVRNVVTWCRPNPPVGALGDKWRPATSDVVVACVSGKRYWDDLATRKDTNNSHATSRASLNRSGIGYHTGDDTGSTAPISDLSKGAPLLDYWEIPPTGYAGAHYAVYPPALVEPLVKAMGPQRVCRVCGEPSRRAMEHLGIDRRPNAPVPSELGAYLRANLNGYTLASLAADLDLPETQLSHYFRTDEAGARLPDADTWTALKTLLSLDDTYDAGMAVVAAEYENVDYGSRLIPERLSGGTNQPKVVPTGAWSDCGHNDWRPGVVLDPFAGSGTTLAVASGHGLDAIGFDLDSRNEDLARERVGPLLWEVR